MNNQASSSRQPAQPAPAAKSEGASGDAQQSLPKQDTPKPLPAVILPKGGGAIHGMGEQFSLNAVTGTASTSIPVPTSRARSSSLSPDLSLKYDSGAGNGLFGFGWSVSLPSITRRTDKGLPRYQDATESDVFILSGEEDLLPMLEPDRNGQWTRADMLTGNEAKTEFWVRKYRPRVEEAFTRIERWTRVIDGEIHWRTTSRENVTMILGSDSNSRISDPDNPSRVFSWLVSETYDDKGNAMKYQYKSENSDGVDCTKAHEATRSDRSRSANKYPKRIKYGNRTSRLGAGFNIQKEAWMFEVVFDYGDHDDSTPRSVESRPWPSRSDAFSTYRPTFELRTYRLCQRILMFHNFPDEENIGNDCLVSSVDINYQDTSKNSPLTPLGNAIASFITSVEHVSYVRSGARYARKSIPPVEFAYSEAEISDEVHDVDPVSLANLPAGLVDAVYEFLDLNGEGVSGIVARQSDGGLFYKTNLGNARFGALETLPVIPSMFRTPQKWQQWLDLAGDGEVSLVEFDGPCPGFYKRNKDALGGWEGFRTFTSLPVGIAWQDPSLRLIDLRGTGLADVLIVNEEIFTYYPALAEHGFGTPEYWRPPLDEDAGPRILLSDGVESVYFADMTADGLSDLVRIRNGEICYWPNLGYGGFGSKVSMDNAPWFDTAEFFRQNSLRLADIDGSGTTDIVYCGSSGVAVYQNQAGNSWTNGKFIHSFPSCTDMSKVEVIDLLGQGTSCVVWSSRLTSDSGRQMRYINLLSDGKPYLMTSMINNLGSEIFIKYRTSTDFYLADKAEGRLWATRLPFPVHVVSEVQTFDRINGNQFSTRHAYHEGYYDGVEREFRGFGMIEAWDAEDFAETQADTSVENNATNFDPSFKSPPVLTKTWYHTGAFFENKSIMEHFRSSFYEEPGTEAGNANALLLPETEVPSSIRHGTRYLQHELSPGELRESYRALRGSLIRQEIYAVDGTQHEMLPYLVKQKNYVIDMLQPRGCNRYAMYFTQSKESVEMQYERALFSVSGRIVADPRMSHSLNLVTDEYGNVLESVNISYGRRLDDFNPTISPDDLAKQKKLLATLTLQGFTNAIIECDSYRTPLLYESETYELVNFPKLCTDGYFTPLVRAGHVHEIVNSVASGRFDLPFEDFTGSGAVGSHVYRRRLSRKRSLFRSDDLSSVLTLGRLESKALPFEDYTEVFTKQLAEATYMDSSRFESHTTLTSALEIQGGYVHSRGDDNWWSPSGRVLLSPSRDVDELKYAQEHFYLARRYRDPFYSESFDTESSVTYDKYDLLVIEARDALGNLSTVGTRNRDPLKPIEGPGYDYRVLSPLLVMDPNRNRTAAAYDILGHVTATAVMGKPGTNEGDELSGFTLDVTESELSDYTATPLANGAELLGNATSRIVYDLWSYYRNKSNPNPRPVVTATLSRETHRSDLARGQKTRIQLSFLYSDGFGRSIQTKTLAEPYPKTFLPRWVASGWQILNNKGNVVRTYEPFFTESNHYESNLRAGVSTTLLYDPLQRLVAKLDAKHSYSKTTWSPWSQQLWDQNDTVLANPAEDPDVSGYFRRLPELDYLPTWYQARTSGAKGDEKAAALKAAIHANTPTKVLFDSLGRSILTISHNAFQRALAAHRVEEFYVARRILDISGNVRVTTDNLDRVAEVASYDMTGNVINKASMESGERWSLNSATAQPIFAWTSRGFQFSTTYDQIQRPLSTNFRQFDGQEFLVSKTLYGELEDDAEILNLRTRIIQTQDQAAVKKFKDYDFKGNMLSMVTQVPESYSLIIDWTDSSKVSLDSDIYEVSTTYDAFNRPITAKQPDNSVIQTGYNITNQVQQMNVKMDGSSDWQPILVDEQFNARNQRILTHHGNGVETKYEYDPYTFSLISMITIQTINGSTPPKSLKRSRTPVQDLHYTYDPMENITCTRDGAQQRIFFKNTVVDPSSSYTYDALYRLIEASGREHLGQIDASSPYGPGDDHRIGLPNSGDGKAMGTYMESYYVDAAGNMLRVQHSGSDAMQPGWTRRYKYEEPSQIQPKLFNNRLSSTTIGNKTEFFRYEGNAGLSGNITSMSHLSSMQWDFRDRLQITATQRVQTGTPESTWYAYGDDGVRLRKFTDRAAEADQKPVKKSHRLYLGSYEIYRVYSGDGLEVSLERKTLHITNGSGRVAMVDTKTVGERDGPQQLFRYQYSDNLDSSVLELDEKGDLISYEEYYPYGSTSYQAVRSQLLDPKRYRYTGKERDEESGLDYHGARYYAPWIGRWISPDPIGGRDDLDLYAYVKCNPIIEIDPTGTEGQGDQKNAAPVTWSTPPAAPAAAPAAAPSSAPQPESPPEVNPPFGDPEHEPVNKKEWHFDSDNEPPDVNKTLDNFYSYAQSLWSKGYVKGQLNPGGSPIIDSPDNPYPDAGASNAHPSDYNPGPTGVYDNNDTTQPAPPGGPTSNTLFTFSTTFGFEPGLKFKKAYDEPPKPDTSIPEGLNWGSPGQPSPPPPIHNPSDDMKPSPTPSPSPLILGVPLPNFLAPKPAFPTLQLGPPAPKLVVPSVKLGVPYFSPQPVAIPVPKLQINAMGPPARY